MVPVYTAELGISLICTFTAALGYLTLSVGLAARGDFNRPACVVAALAASRRAGGARGPGQLAAVTRTSRSRR